MWDLGLRGHMDHMDLTPAVGGLHRASPRGDIQPVKTDIVYRCLAKLQLVTFSTDVLPS